MSTPEADKNSQPRARRGPGRLVRATRVLRGVFLRYGHLLPPAIAAVLTLSSTYILLGPVLNRSGDNIYHLMSEYALAYAFRFGDDPFGPLGLEFGIPLLRFYQCLFYLMSVGLSIGLDLDLRFVHNLLIVLCFAASPFAYLYFLRKLGLSKWAASLGSMLSMVSVAAFGNSFEAYHQAGIVTQALGGLFFPLFMGNFIGMLRGENRAATTAFLFAVAFLSHAIMSVYAAFAGAFYFLVADVGLRRNWRRLMVFCLIGMSLVAFWVLPFLTHTYEKRAVPESIIRGRGVHWFTSVSRAELSTVLRTGRLLDDPPRKGGERDKDDIFMDKISIIGTLKTRPPVLTALTALGALVALLGLRRTSNRFLLGGFAFSLMLFAGPDDFRFINYLPFIKFIQTFRFTYLVEFFAFGLAAVGIEAVLRQLYNFARTRRRFLRYPLIATWVLLIAIGLSWIGSEIIGLGQAHLLIRDPVKLDAMVDAMGSLKDRGYPFRADVQFPGRRKIRHGWLSAYDYNAYCTHWKGVGPTPGYHLCTGLGGLKRNPNLYALAGIRWISGQGDDVKSTREAKDEEGDVLFELLPNGKDRRGKPNTWHSLLDTGRDHLLRPLLGRPVPVVCNDAQWIWLAKSWTTRYRGKLWDRDTPILMRVPAGTLATSGLTGQAPALMYLDHTQIDEDKAALTAFAGKGGVVVTPMAIPGVDAEPAGQTSVWERLPAKMQRIRSKRPQELEREELDPGFEVAEIKRYQPRGRSHQLFAFDVDALEPLVLVLPTQLFQGWQAELDGKPHPLFATGPDLVGVRLPSGAHRLVFRWQMPGWHKATLVASLLALVLVVGIWAVAIFRRARGRRRVKGTLV
jgi:hypothetical protein